MNVRYGAENGEGTDTLCWSHPKKRQRQSATNFENVVHWMDYEEPRATNATNVHPKGNGSFMSTTIVGAPKEKGEYWKKKMKNEKY